MSYRKVSGKRPVVYSSELVVTEDLVIVSPYTLCVSYKEDLFQKIAEKWDLKIRGNSLYTKEGLKVGLHMKGLIYLNCTGAAYLVEEVMSGSLLYTNSPHDIGEIREDVHEAAKIIANDL